MSRPYVPQAGSTSDHSRKKGWFAGLVRRSPCDTNGLAHVGRHHIYILPTGFGVVFAGVLMLMLLGSLNYQNNLGLLFTFLMGSVGLVAMHHTWFNLLGLQVSARGGPAVFAGQEAMYTVTLTHARRRSRPDIGVRGSGTSPVVLDPAGSAAVAVRVGTRTRGLCKLDSVEIETRYPLGLFRAWCYASTRGAVVVYPKPTAISQQPPMIPAYRQCSIGDLGVGADEFLGPRDYRPGDSPRRLDWKALARERGLFVKEFGGDRASQVWLDWSRVPGAEEEARLSSLCRQVLDVAETGLTYGLRLPGRTIPMGHGDAHKHRCLEALASFNRG